MGAAAIEPRLKELFEYELKEYSPSRHHLKHDIRQLADPPPGFQCVWH